MQADLTYVVTAGAARVIGARRLTWCYLGMDVAARGRLRRAYGGQVPVGRALTEIALRLKQPFLDWIAALGWRQRDPQRWWASALASKSPLQSDLFFLTCYGEALALWARSGSPAQVIVIEDAWLWSAAREWFRDEPGLTFSGPGAVTRCAGAARLRCRGLWAVAAFVAWSTRAMIGARRSFPRDDRPLPADGALIFSWIEARVFDGQGRFRDPYSGRLAEFLTARGIQVSRLTPLLVPRHFWRGLRESRERVLVAPAFIRLRDVLRAATGGLTIDAMETHGMFQQRDHRLLLARQRLTELAGMAFRQHQLWYWTARRMAATAAGSRTTVVYPFENQPHEKLLCLAWRDGSPDGRLVGYVMAGIPSLLLSFFLGADESRFQPLPDRIVTNGPASRDLLAANGYPPGRIVDGGALRFEHLEPLLQKCRGAARPTPPRVLVALPTVAPYARLLFEDLLHVCDAPMLDPVSGDPVQFVVTFHVDLPAAAVVRSDDHVPASMTLSGKPVRDLLDETRLCLFAPPTGSWREAMIAGVPALRYQPDLLDIDPVDGLSGVDLPVCTHDGLRQSILEALRSAPVAADERERLLRHVYSPVNESVWLSVLGRISGSP